MFDYSRGSEWNKWDLHLHTASSYDYKYKGKDADELLCKTLIENNIKAVAITDHFTIDPNRIENLRKLSPEIVFFPGVELRTDKGANNLHVILIFSEQSNIFELASDFDAIMIRNEAKSREDNQRIYWNFETIIDFAKKHDALVTIHAGNKTNGIDKEITSALPVKDAIKEEIASNIHFFEIGKIKDKDEYDNIVFKEIDVKPLIICSDCHNPKDYKTNENLWIKADLTFIGLKQCLYQPKERVYIGLIPPLLDRYNKNKSNIIDNISINRVDKPKNDTVKWFDVNLPLNSGMIAIIGNKGSGKSALTDIIGHLNRCHTMESASFLNDGRFKKPPTKYANDYEGCLKWADGKTTKLNLDIKNNEETIEDAFYLPQAHIENICNDIDNKFQKEINEVIFGYIDVTERGISHKLDELINEKSRQVSIKIQNKIDKLHVINDIIIQLENKKTEKYKSLINEKIKKIEETLCRHEKQKPIEIKKPTQTNNMEYVSKLNELNKQIEIIKNSIETKKVELINVNEFLETANNLIVEISDIENQFNIIRLHVNYFFNKYNLDISDNQFVINTPKEFLNNLVKETINDKNRIIDSLGNSETGLKSLLLQLEQQKSSLIASADNEDRLYQKYLSDLEEWENKKKQIIGDILINDSFEYYKAEKEYIENELENVYTDTLNNRNLLLKQIYHAKEELIEIYQDLYLPIQKEITGILGEIEDSIAFKAELFVNNKLLEQDILKYIDLRYSGKYSRAKGQNYLEELIRNTDFKTFDSLVSFVEETVKVITEDFDNADKKVGNRLGFYNYLFSLDYIDVNFKLKMGERSLDELSPGERGLVLLIFYLALNKESKPIIIDQPEDNLDNQSVFSKLVPCICKAKQKRQVIIVTHNPNIAIACDAEQIIYCEMDKTNSKISYISGSIENPKIKKHIIDVLEGTQPAFELRRQKYLLEKTNKE